MDWHLVKIDKCINKLGTSLNGLSSAEAGKRLTQHGPNELIETAGKTLFMMFLDQFKDFMIVVLIAAAVVSGVIGELADTIAIIVIIILNAVIGFVQEYRAEKAMKALKQMAAPNAVVRRNGKMENIDAALLVPGDMVILEAGRIVPADIRLTEAAQLKAEEAALTGESAPTDKITDALHEKSVSLGDRINMLYKGTVIAYGRGSGIVTATGMETELGKIASMLQGEEEVKTPLQKRLATFGRKLGLIVLAICAIVFISGILRGEDTLLMLLTAISLAVAAIPEALPAVVTISLALGAKKMIKQNTLVRKLPAVETLGSVTYICSDKTGTLTLNKMTVEEIYFNGKFGSVKTGKRGSEEFAMFNAMALNNDSAFDKDNKLIGDPTETALFDIAYKNGFDKKVIEKDSPRIAEIPFDSDRKCMTTFHNAGAWRAMPLQGEVVSFTKGALESVLDRSDNVLINEKIVALDETIRNEIIAVNERMANDGLRTLAFAMRKWDSLPDDMTPDIVEDSLTFIGITGLLDPPREEAKEAVNICKTAGIIPVMITGDHPVTARTIALRLGIIEEGGRVMTGKELGALSIEEFEEVVGNIRVYARVAPEQKIKIVKALQDKGEFAAMTGDGVNDAPALKRADIGIAMGITGTDVSKEAAHMILLDDNFATIVKAIKEGRRIFDNIRKFIKYTMTSNSGEIWTIFLPPFLGLPIPLLPIHILWINLVTDGLPGLALSVEPAEKGIMNKPPRDPKESIFSHGLGWHLLWVGLLMGGVNIFTEAWFIGSAETHWQTMVFTVLSLSQMGHVLAIRSDRESLFTLGLFSNKPLLGAVLLTFLLQMSTIYVPAMNTIFKTAPLTAGELLCTLGLSSIVFIAVEIEKWFFRRRNG